MRSSKRASKAELRKLLLRRGVEDVVLRKHLEQALSSGRKLRVKLGIDPTAPDLHLGHSVVLRKLKQFQDLGHQVVFIIGDFTARVGDPSGQSRERKILSPAVIKQNMKKYLAQAGKIIDLRQAEVRYNSEWLADSVEDILELAKAATINQVSERADFKERLGKGQKVTILEAIYALLQGFDSVNIKADVELGGTDQRLNLLMGRQVQRHFGQKEQDILTVPLLEGTDGTNKMSKSQGNYIALNESPKEMFGKVMSIPDKLIYKYFELCTDVSEAELSKIKQELRKKSAKPMAHKLHLASEIVALYHGKKEATGAKVEFEKVFREKELPSKIATKILPRKTYALPDLMAATNLAPSKSAARRLIEQGGVRLAGERVVNPAQQLKLSSKGTLIQVGKRRFLKVRTK